MTKRERLEKKIRERCKLPCHRCGSYNFELFDGVGMMQRKMEDLEFSQDTILVVCSYCGAVTEHLIYVLERRKTN